MSEENHRIWRRKPTTEELLRMWRGREFQGQGQGLENWSSRILEDKDFPRGQQLW